jgi:hypothetical protein
MKVKTRASLFILLISFSHGYCQSVSITNDGSEADNSAMLEIKSTDKGLLPPRMSLDQILAIPSPAEGLTVYNTDSHKPVYYNGSLWMCYDGSEMLYVGLLYQGGIIFYTDGNGGGLVCALNDQAFGAEWGCLGTDITSGNGADGTIVGTGDANTEAIVSDCLTAGIAARLCDDYDDGTYADWFLPSRDELDYLYQNKDVVNNTLNNIGGTMISAVSYWSSSEYDANSAWEIGMHNGAQGFAGKSTSCRVRAVREF